MAEERQGHRLQRLAWPELQHGASLEVEHVVALYLECSVQLRRPRLEEHRDEARHLRTPRSQ